MLMFVLFMIALIIFVGLGLDLGFAYITKANLSKAVDAAALMAMRNVSRGTATAQSLGSATFAANYGRPRRDVSVVSPVITFGTENNNLTVDVSATATISTFFIRVLGAIPGLSNWETLQVSSTARATRPNLILSLVLDRSSSMLENGGSSALPGAVANFIDLFDDDLDRASLSTFSWGSSVDVPMEHNFKQDIKDAAQSMAFIPLSTTCAERGLTNGFAQNESVTPLPGEQVVKIVVFFTDGMANTFNYEFDCGSRDIFVDGLLFDPVTGATAGTGCTVPVTVSAIDPQTGTLTPDAVTVTSCEEMHFQAEDRAERIAYLARAQENIVFSIGMGSPGAEGECGGTFPVLNPAFLKKVANSIGSANYNSDQPTGDYAIAANSGELDQVFQEIANKILARLSR